MITVEKYHKKDIGLWVIIAKNESGEQVGKLTYATNEEEANKEVKRIQEYHKMG
jgi:hypothetical protein